MSQFLPPPEPRVKPPTREEIEALTAEIREGWTEEDYRQRAPHLFPRPKPYTVPLVEGLEGLEDAL